MKARIRIVALCAALVFVFCAQAPRGITIWGAKPYSPGEQEYAAWRYAVSCTEVEPDFPFLWVRWMVMDSARAPNVPKDRVVAGLAVYDEQLIYIRREFRNHPGVMAHEILHLLLPRVPHDAPEFRRCDPIREDF
jgi:hypothetical protein